MNQISTESLEFLEEARDAFNKDTKLSTYRDGENGEFIALRSGFREDCILIYELGEQVGNFVGQLPKQHKVVIDFDEYEEMKQKIEGLEKEVAQLNSESNEIVTNFKIKPKSTFNL